MPAALREGPLFGQLAYSEETWALLWKWEHKDEISCLEVTFLEHVSQAVADSLHFSLKIFLVMKLKEKSLSAFGGGVCAIMRRKEISAAVALTDPGHFRGFFELIKKKCGPYFASSQSEENVQVCVNFYKITSRSPWRQMSTSACIFLLKLPHLLKLHDKDSVFICSFHDLLTLLILFCLFLFLKYTPVGSRLHLD